MASKNGSNTFVGRHSLWSDEQHVAAQQVLATVQEKELEVVRLSFPDQHGLLRGKGIFRSALQSAMYDGCTMTTTLLLKDTSHRTAYPVWQSGAGLDMDELTGAGNFIMVPDPCTFHVLPWAPDTGWMMCDIYFPDGRPVPFSTRRLLQKSLARLEELGYDYICGLEVEFALFRLEDSKLAATDAGQPGTPPDVQLLSQGYQYLTEERMDQLDPALVVMRRQLLELGLPLRSVEVEFGPSQVEFTFNAGAGLEMADNMVLFRNAVKQIARREGYHATFMCRPAIPNIFSNGWHLHQSLVERQTGQNALMPAADEDLLSPFGRHFVAGLLEHARAACVFTTPTINGYKRYKPYTLAPDRVLWGRDNKGAMIRILGGAEDPATRIENRVGEPAANPYLFLTSQIVSGLDGVQRQLEPSTPADEPYTTEAEKLPASLMEACQALRQDDVFAAALGQQFVDYMLTLKEFEISRFLSEVTDWEQREYFGLF
jgi:glutamine synthetase